MILAFPTKVRLPLKSPCSKEGKGPRTGWQRDAVTTLPQAVQPFGQTLEGAGIALLRTRNGIA
ncbi:hypothetical protein SK3146_04097 [Paenibacillus konkukensis]|uniref:Uncharacterized protein n=1 Tax=Paenibacillus konkukensis TaxID=2020716 RepID=A0ABY4RSB0_9BACL|nr:hypothetical protein SK3146_04097 [Paenibacillus konkukensis]